LTIRGAIPAKLQRWTSPADPAWDEPRERAPTGAAGALIAVVAWSRRTKRALVNFLCIGGGKAVSLEATGTRGANLLR